MSSVTCFNLDWSKILLSGNQLRNLALTYHCLLAKSKKKIYIDRIIAVKLFWKYGLYVSDFLLKNLSQNTLFCCDSSFQLNSFSFIGENGDFSGW